MTLTSEQKIEKIKRRRQELLERSLSFPKAVRLDIPEMGEDGHVWVRMISSTGEDVSLAKELLGNMEGTDEQQRDALGGLLVLFLGDEDGHSIFTKEDARELSQRPLFWTQRILTKAIEVNGLADTDQDREGN